LDAFIALGAILGALLIGAIRPGPSFVLVARISIAHSRRDGLAAALAMGVGGVILGGLALLGLRTLLMHAGWLYLGLKVVGGVYLLYLGIRLWRGANEPIAVADTGERASARPGWSFAIALATQLSNPKAAVIYGSIFAALLPAHPPLWMCLALPPLILLVEAGWYLVVALAFSSARPRAAYLRSKRWVDRLAGSVMGALGVRLILDTGRPA
jgi:threonine/homoserine/homoserine lactone efflux protein